VYNRLVQRRHWVSDAEFLSGVALGRIVPGSGGVNLTVQIGQRLRGAAGAAAAVLALLVGPLVIVVGLAVIYAQIGRNPVLQAVLDGVAAAAIGLTFATGLRLVEWRPANIGSLAVTLVTVLCVGVLRWPMVPVVLCLAPVSVGLALVRRPAHGRRGNA
jgi:chromate transporter